MILLDIIRLSQPNYSNHNHINLFYLIIVSLSWC